MNTRTMNLKISGVMAISLLLIFGAMAARGAQKDRQRVFPLETGTYWVYEGKIAWQNESGIHEKHVTWKMEVVDQTKRGDYLGYLMKGHPSDLAFYEEGRTPSDYAIIQHKDTFYETEASAFDRLQNSSDDLKDLLFDNEIALKFPLKIGSAFGDPEMLKRDDHFYCWFAQEEHPFLRKIPGVAFSKILREYVLTLMTLPDGTTRYFTPGIGITRYQYSHHGTVSEVDVSLIEYHAGKK